MNNLIVIILLSILLAPAPWGIALNHETKECAGYWGGDEYKGYPLPAGWTAYYPHLAPVPIFLIAIILCASLLVFLVITLGVIGLVRLTKGGSFSVWKRSKKRQ